MNKIQKEINGRVDKLRSTLIIQDKIHIHGLLLSEIDKIWMFRSNNDISIVDDIINIIALCKYALEFYEDVKLDYEDSDKDEEIKMLRSLIKKLFGMSVRHTKEPGPQVGKHVMRLELSDLDLYKKLYQESKND